MASVPGSQSIECLAEALINFLGKEGFTWIGSPPGPEIDNIGWKLTEIPGFLFSVSTHAGELPMGVYDFQVSVSDDSLENGDIVFLDDVSLRELCDAVERFAQGEVAERFG